MEVAVDIGISVFFEDLAATAKDAAPGGPRLHDVERFGNGRAPAVPGVREHHAKRFAPSVERNARGVSNLTKGAAAEQVIRAGGTAIALTGPVLSGCEEDELGAHRGAVAPGGAPRSHLGSVRTQMPPVCAQIQGVAARAIRDDPIVARGVRTGWGQEVDDAG